MPPACYQLSDEPPPPESPPSPEKLESEDEDESLEELELLQLELSLLDDELAPTDIHAPFHSMTSRNEGGQSVRCFDANAFLTVPLRVNALRMLCRRSA